MAQNGGTYPFRSSTDFSNDDARYKPALTNVSASKPDAVGRCDACPVFHLDDLGRINARRTCNVDFRSTGRKRRWYAHPLVYVDVPRPGCWNAISSSPKFGGLAGFVPPRILAGIFDRKSCHAVAVFGLLHSGSRVSTTRTSRLAIGVVSGP